MSHQRMIWTLVDNPGHPRIIRDPSGPSESAVTTRILVYTSGVSEQVNPSKLTGQRIYIQGVSEQVRSDQINPSLVAGQHRGFGAEPLGSCPVATRYSRISRRYSRISRTYIRPYTHVYTKHILYIHYLGFSWAISVHNVY